LGLAPPGGYAFPLTPVELADTTGLSTVHVNRALHDLRESGLIDADAGFVRVLDATRLRQIARFDPTYLHLKVR